MCECELLHIATRNKTRGHNDVALYSRHQHWTSGRIVNHAGNFNSKFTGSFRMRRTGMQKQNNSKFVWRHSFVKGDTRLPNQWCVFQRGPWARTCLSTNTLMNWDWWRTVQSAKQMASRARRRQTSRKWNERHTITIRTRMLDCKVWL